MTKLIESNRLPDLAAQINDAHNEAVASIKKGIGHALECGAALVEAKAVVPHGQWSNWLSTNTSISERTAQRYMQLSRERPALETKTATVADLTIRGACELIAEPLEKPSEAVEAWRLVPDPGHSLAATIDTTAGMDFAIITPSIYPMFFYCTHIWVSAEKDSDDIPVDGTMTTLKKPVKWQQLPEITMLVCGVDLATADWKQQRFLGRVDRNPWEIADHEGADALWRTFFPDAAPINRPGRSWPKNRKELRQALKEGSRMGGAK